MRLILFHPAVAKLDCRDCQEKLYDLETGKPATYKATDENGNKIDRELQGGAQQLGFPPCKHGRTCPKESPEDAWKHELTSENQRCLKLYWRHKAAPNSEPLDELTRENFAIIESVYHDWEQRQRAELLGFEVAKAVAGLLAR